MFMMYGDEARQRLGLGKEVMTIRCWEKLAGTTQRLAHASAATAAATTTVTIVVNNIASLLQNISCRCPEAMGSGSSSSASGMQATGQAPFCLN